MPQSSAAELMKDFNKRFAALSNRITKFETWEPVAGGASFSGLHAWKEFANQDIAAGAFAKVTFDAVLYDTDAYIALPSDTIVFPTTGYYLIVFRPSIYWSVAPVTYLYSISISLNHAYTLYTQYSGTDYDTRGPFNTFAAHFNAGDDVTFELFNHDIGAGVLTCPGNLAYDTYLDIIKVG